MKSQFDSVRTYMEQKDVIIKVKSMKFYNSFFKKMNAAVKKLSAEFRWTNENHRFSVSELEDSPHINKEMNFKEASDWADNFHSHK